MSTCLGLNLAQDQDQDLSQPVKAIVSSSPRKSLIGDMGGWSRCSVPLLFACNNNRFSRDEDHFIMFKLVSKSSGFC